MTSALFKALKGVFNWSESLLRHLPETKMRFTNEILAGSHASRKRGLSAVELKKAKTPNRTEVGHSGAREFIVHTNS